MTTLRVTQSYPTLGAIVALAFISACLGHEVIGHGGSCLLLGGRIRLLSSVYFRCSNGGPITDAAGPLGNLAFGAVCWGMLRARPEMSQHGRLWLVFAMAFNLFWGSGYFIFSAVTGTGDWAYVLRALSLHPEWLWRGLMGLLGIVLYERSLRVVGACLPVGTPLVFSWLVAGAVSCGAGLFFAGPILPVLRESAQESFGAGVGLLFLALRRRGAGAPLSIPPRQGWVIVAATVIVVFVLTLGRGYILNR